MGNGDIPLVEAIQLLEQEACQDLYSLEWEKAWCPELAEIDTALPAHMAYMKGLTY